MGGEPLEKLKQAVMWLLDDTLSADIRVGVTNFGLNTSVAAPLGAHPNEIREGLAGLSADGGTPMDDGLLLCNAELQRSQGGNRELVTVLVTDGQPNSPDETAKVADTLKQSSRLFTIGVGARVSEQFLRELASSPSDYRFAREPKDIQGIFAQISTLLLDTRELRLPKRKNKGGEQ